MQTVYVLLQTVANRAATAVPCCAARCEVGVAATLAVATAVFEANTKQPESNYKATIKQLHKATIKQLCLCGKTTEMQTSKNNITLVLISRRGTDTSVKHSCFIVAL